jgi:hypothetical protein
MLINSMLNTALRFYGRGQSAKLKNIALWEHCKEYVRIRCRSPFLSTETIVIIMGWCQLELWRFKPGVRIPARPDERWTTELDIWLWIWFMMSKMVLINRLFRHSILRINCLFHWFCIFSLGISAEDWRRVVAPPDYPAPSCVLGQ